MKVTLVEYTGRPDPWRAADVMIFTKNTRVEMAADGLDQVAAWPVERKMRELAYMANTIPSSWEFCDYTFVIQDVTRALTHQLVRTRTASYAQQTMQVLDVRGWRYDCRVVGEERRAYDACMENIAQVYDELVDAGVKIEHARGVLPTNILTNIAMKCSMRTFVDLVHKRESPRNLGEISELMLAMKAAVLEVHPWMSVFLARTFDQAASDLDREIMALDLPQDRKMGLCKLVDQMRQRS